MLTASEYFPPSSELLTVMTAVPLATAVTVPEPLTVATLLLEDFQVSGLDSVFVSIELRLSFCPLSVRVVSVSETYSVRFCVTVTVFVWLPAA